MGGGRHEVVQKLGADTRYAAKVDAGAWTGEWAIPLAAVGIRCVPGVKLGFNLGAFRSETGEWIILAGALGSIWQLDNGGTVVLE